MERHGAAPTEADSAVDDPSEDSPVATADSPADVRLIRDQLREKEQLVAALTERLEQAAEQLDRLRRTGADKGRRPMSGGGLPVELVEEHKTTLDDLKRVITNWENIQAGAALGRIETQIIELRDLLVSSGPVRGPAVQPAAPAAPSRERPAEVPAAPARPAEPAAPRPGGKAGSNAWWEAQKAALMGEPVSAEVQAALAAAKSAPSAEPDDQPTAAPVCDLAGFAVPDLPEPIDFEQITIDDARAAIRERDRLIEKMREPLLLWTTTGQLPAGLASMADVPAALKECVAQFEAQWQTKFRQAELDLSLERARLAREYAAVKQQQQQQQDVLQKGSKNSPSSGKGGRDAEPTGDDDSASKRRWFRFMGSGEEGDSGEPPAKK